MNFKLPIGFEKIELPYYNEWIAALESGKYKKGFGRLRSGEQYCCLGVLSEIQGRLKLGASGYCDGPTDDNQSTSLNKDNPVFSLLKGTGFFPYGVIAYSDSDITFTNLAAINDYYIDFGPVIEAIKTIWKPVQQPSDFIKALQLQEQAFKHAGTVVGNILQSTADKLRNELLHDNPGPSLDGFLSAIENYRRDALLPDNEENMEKFKKSAQVLEKMVTSFGV